MITKLNINAIENGIIPYEKLNNNIIEKINSKSDKTHTHDYLPLSGGTMSNDIDMNLHSIIKTGVDIVESLPTENLFNGRQVTYEGKLYTYNNNEWNCIADDLGGKPETHEENFVYQPTASDLSVKDGFADIKRIKGNTIVWNQMIEIKTIQTIPGLTIEKTDDYTLKINGTLNKSDINNKNLVLIAYNAIKYPFSGLNKIVFNLKHISGSVSSDVSIGNGYFNGKKIGNTHLVTPLSSAVEPWKSTNIYIHITADTVTFDDYTFSIYCYDITKMFGKGNEPATVEEFEAMFPNDYYEYNEGELMSFDGKGLKSVGFNQWDEEWEVGFVNSIGMNEIRTDSIRSNYIKVLANTKYYIATTNSAYNINESIRIRFYDNNKKHIGNPTIYTPNRLFTTPDGCCYMRWCTYPGTLPTNSYSKGDICINLSHSGYRDSEYEPYQDYTLSFQDGKTISQLTGKLNGEGESITIFPDGLRSAGNVFDEITPDGKAIKRIGTVDMGSLEWAYQSNITTFYTDRLYISFTGEKGKNLVTAKYLTQLYGTGTDGRLDNGCIGGRNFDYEGINYDRLHIKDTGYTDAASFKASLQGQILYYELAEPEVYELDFPINTSYEAYDFGTEEVLYNDDKEVNIPMKANIEYNFNAVDMIRNNHFKIQNLKENLNELRTNSMSSLLEHDTQINNILVEIENNELVTATAITNLEDRTTNVENGLTNKSDIGHTHVSSAITDSIIAGRDITSSATGLVQGRAVYTYTAPANHASSATTYGVATTSDYGHVKIGSGLTVSDGVLSHPTTPGNRHIPSGGTLGQCLKYNDLSGTVKWSNIFNYSKNALTYSTITSPEHTSFRCNESITIPSNSLCHVKLTVKSVGTSLLNPTPFGAKLYNESIIFDMAQGLLIPFVGGSPGQIDLWYFNNTSDDITEVNVRAYSNTVITLSSSLDGLIEGDVLPLASYYEIMSF